MVAILLLSQRSLRPRYNNWGQRLKGAIHFNSTTTATHCTIHILKQRIWAEGLRIYSCKSRPSVLIITLQLRFQRNLCRLKYKHSGCYVVFNSFFSLFMSSAVPNFGKTGGIDFASFAKLLFISVLHLRKRLLLVWNFMTIYWVSERFFNE